MTDEEYVFKQTERERKRDGRGAFNKKRQGGKTVRFPSDYMTKKERESMNGDIKTWKEKEFYTYEEFKKLPQDVQIRHLNSVMTRFNCGLKTIADVEFSTDAQTIRGYLENNGLKQWINTPKRGGSVAERNKAREKLAEAVKIARNAEQEEPVEEKAPEKPVEAVFQAEESERDEIHALDIAALIAALKGTGAKLTIEVTL